MRKTNLYGRILLGAAAVILLCSAAIADTLELKNGQVLQGAYSGGSEDTVRFVINGETRVFHLDEIAAIHFGDSSASPQTSGQPTQPNPPQNPPAADQNGAPQTSPAPAAPMPPQYPPVGDQSSPPANPAAPQNPPPAVAPQAPWAGAEITVPVDTPLTIRMIDGIDSSVDRPGKRFRASLDQDLVVNGVIVAPKGTDVWGRLIYAKQPGQIQGHAELRLELSSIMINGRARALTTGEYDAVGKDRGKQSAERIGGAAVGGAIIGGILGGGQGAAAGAAIGAGAGTAVQLYTHGDQVRVPSETKLQFKLVVAMVTEPTLPPVQ